MTVPPFSRVLGYDFSALASNPGEPFYVGQIWTFEQFSAELGEDGIVREIQCFTESGTASSVEFAIYNYIAHTYKGGFPAHVINAPILTHTFSSPVPTNGLIRIAGLALPLFHGFQYALAIRPIGGNVKLALGTGGSVGEASNTLWQNEGNDANGGIGETWTPRKETRPRAAPFGSMTSGLAVAEAESEIVPAHGLHYDGGSTIGADSGRRFAIRAGASLDNGLAMLL